jgi:Tfp pilus assembly protein PilO
MKNWIPQKNTFSFVIGITVICATIYFAVFAIVFLEIRKIEVAYNDSESESRRNEKAEALRLIAAANKDQIQILRNFFVQKEDDVGFIKQIEDTGRRSGVLFDIKSIEVPPNQKDVFKEDVSIKMNIEGSWTDTMRFIESLEKMPFGVSIQNVNVDLTSKGKWGGSIDFIIFRSK